MDETLERLLWDRVDGDLSADDRARLEAMLQSDESGREARRELEALSNLLDRAREATPEVPSSLRPLVLNQLRARRTSRPQRSRVGLLIESTRNALFSGLNGNVPRKETLMGRKRLALMAAAAVVVAGVVGLLLINDFPPKGGVTGAIGGVERADRHREAQLRSEDVAVEGVSSSAAVSPEVYDRLGVDQEGFDREGFNRFGFDQEGFDREGFNQLGFDREGFNQLGFDQEGFDREGFERDSLDRGGFDRDVVRIR